VTRLRVRLGRSACRKAPMAMFHRLATGKTDQRIPPEKNRADDLCSRDHRGASPKGFLLRQGVPTTATAGFFQNTTYVPLPLRSAKREPFVDGRALNGSPGMTPAVRRTPCACQFREVRRGPKGACLLVEQSWRLTALAEKNQDSRPSG